MHLISGHRSCDLSQLIFLHCREDHIAAQTIQQQLQLLFRLQTPSGQSMYGGLLANRSLLHHSRLEFLSTRVCFRHDRLGDGIASSRGVQVPHQDIRGLCHTRILGGRRYTVHQWAARVRSRWIWVTHAGDLATHARVTHAGDLATRRMRFVHLSLCEDGC